jgi:hypothetical protein
VAVLERLKCHPGVGVRKARWNDDAISHLVEKSPNPDLGEAQVRLVTRTALEKNQGLILCNQGLSAFKYPLLGTLMMSTVP